MSYRSGHYSEYPQHHPHDHGRASARRPAGEPCGGRRRAAAQDGYTLVHAGKQVRFGPVVFWIVVGTVTVLGMWSAATATYFAFRDDVLTRLIARQAEMQYAYEDRIAELRAKVDRTTSRQLLDQEQFDQKLDQIMRRQTTLESRATALGAIPDAASPDRSGRRRGAPQPTMPPPSGTPKPSPISDTVIFVAPPDREARLESRAPIVASRAAEPVRQGPGRRQRPGPPADLARQGREPPDGGAQRGRRRHGIAGAPDARRLHRSRPRHGATGSRDAARAGMGGPFVPVKLPADAGPFERQLYRINITRAQVERLNRTLALVPYRKPVVGEVEFTSGFGVRSDPFLGRPAMHTGLDFRAAMGDPVRATANGKVVSAGWAGGYGRMVEIDHGNGLSTRYGHLSEIGVKVGDPIKIGQVIGEVGSTGRSTGPHLHYETRIDGEAVDPQKFLRAGVRLAAG